MQRLKRGFKKNLTVPRLKFKYSHVKLFVLDGRTSSRNINCYIVISIYSFTESLLLRIMASSPKKRVGSSSTGTDRSQNIQVFVR